MKTQKYSELVFINQSSGTLMIDIVNAFVGKYEQLVLISGAEEGGKYLTGLCEGVKTDKIVVYRKTTTFRRLWSWAVGWLQIWFKITFKYRKAELFIVSNPPMATLLPLFCRNSYSLLIYDTYPDVLVSTGIFGADSRLVRWWKRKNVRLFQKARNIYTIGEGMQDCLAQYVDKARIRVIPNWADLSRLKPIAKSENPFICQHHLEDKFVVLYSGNLGNTHKVETIAEVAEILKEEQDICFVIIGEGAKKKKIEQQIKEKALQNCLLLPFQPVDRLPYSLGAADVGIVTLDLTASRLSVPSKTYSMLAVGCCMLGIAGHDSELAKIIEGYEAGKVFEPEEADRIAGFIKEMKENTEKLNFYKRNAREAALHFTPENARCYVEWYE